MLTRYQTLVVISTSLPKFIGPLYPNFIALSIRHLESLLPVFQQYYVAHDIEAPPPIPTADDPDQNVSLPTLISSIFEFLGLATRSGRMKPFFIDNNEMYLERCVRSVPLWAQMTEDDVSGLNFTVEYVILKFVGRQRENWTSDSNAFIAEQDDDAPLVTLRTATIDFVQVCTTCF